MSKRHRNKHRRPGRVGVAAKRMAIATTATAFPVAGALVPTSADAASMQIWDQLAECESGGSWQINTGNGFYGGLQFAASTWAAFGGRAYAPRADLASKSAQIIVAERVLTAQGWDAWPACSRKLGLTDADKGGSAGVSAKPAAPARQAAASRAGRSEQRVVPSAKHVVRHGKPAARHASATSSTRAGADYTVRPGDTLSEIAARYDVGGGWQALYQRNRHVVGANPNLIVPGQGLDVR